MTKKLKKVKDIKRKTAMHNITIGIPDNYEENLKYLIKMKIIPSRSEAVRNAIRDFLKEEYNKNLDILDYWHNGRLKYENSDC